MATLNMVLGTVETGDLGFTLSHEHVMSSSAGVRQTYPEFLDRAGAIEKAVKDLKEAYSEGLRTLIDMTTLDLGRDIRLLEEVSRRTGINIMAATGTWQDIPRVFWNAHPDRVAALYVREIEEGIEETGIKAGIIKVATDRGGVTEPNAVILRAAARAHNKTGTPIGTHTWAPERVGDQQVKIFEEEGVDLNRVFIGHSNDSTDMEYLFGLLEKGVWVALDRYPGGHMPGTPDWKTRTLTAKKLIDAGYADRILLSHDWNASSNIQSAEALEWRRQNNPDGYLFITRRVLPELLALGVSADTIESIMVGNPRRFFEGS